MTVNAECSMPYMSLTYTCHYHAAKSAEHTMSSCGSELWFIQELIQELPKW